MFFLFFALSGLCESTDWVEVPILLSQCLEEVDSVKQCALLKKVSLLPGSMQKLITCTFQCICYISMTKLFSLTFLSFCNF